MGSVQPSGPHHLLMCSHDDQAPNVSAIGASNARMATNSLPSTCVHIRPGTDAVAGVRVWPAAEDSPSGPHVGAR